MSSRRGRAGRTLVTLLLCLAWTVSSGAGEPAGASRILDDFADAAPWHASASDGARAKATLAGSDRERGLRLDFDLGSGAGYAMVRRSLPFDLPDNYEISFDVRGAAAANNLEFKLIDESGDNVWWAVRRNFQFGTEWQHIRIRKRQIEFAWGPTSDRTLRHAASLELAISAGQGGSGVVDFANLVLRSLPADGGGPPALATASSSLPGGDASLALDGKLETSWQSDPAAGAEQSLSIDFGRDRELGGVVLRWQDGKFATRYDVDFSDDGKTWRTVRRVLDGNGGRDPIMLADAETRYLRLALHAGPAASYGLGEIEVRDWKFGASVNAFYTAIAADSRRGLYPRGFVGEQGYWTLVGVDGGSDSALISEDGAIEAGKGGFSIEPFVVADSHLYTWADVDSRQSLRSGYLPVPSVTWRQPTWELRTTAFAAGSAAQSRLVARYELVNRSERAQSLQLVLAVRPFQVNPPSQFLNTPGGVSPIRELRWDGRLLRVNGERSLYPLMTPDQAGGSTFDAASLPDDIVAAKWHPAPDVQDDFGYASAALVYRVDLPPHATRVIGWVMPLTGNSGAPELSGQAAAVWLDGQETATAAGWERALAGDVSFVVPPQAQSLIDTLRTATAHILVSRQGSALRPGTRAYARSWIRDGAMISEALLRLGQGAVVDDYLDWYAPYQFADGKVPCCVDGRGADPVPENDADGEYIHLAAEAYRYGRDRKRLAVLWPGVDKAARHIEALRQSERSEANRSPERRAFYGLLPASISHEGYSAKPMHSYWDDFWALRGLDDAVALASVLGQDEAQARLQMQRDDFRRDLHASIAAAMAARGIDYIPGCAELGDFDATSTTIALSPGGEQLRLPQAALRRTFERYWREFSDRRDGRRSWDDYTPYEWRTVSSFVRLGWRERAQQLIGFFMADRRPSAWNQWPEVIGRDPRRPRFLGDLPHAWVASDFIRSTLDLFAYERGDDQSLVLAAGILAEWLDGRGIAVSGLHTPYGVLNYRLRRDGRRIELDIDAGSGLPPGGFVFAWPGREAPGWVRVNGKRAAADGGVIVVRTVPGRIVAEER